jgi:D-serine dehydratase
VFKVEEQIWTGPHLQYRISALGQVASGSIDVAEDYVRLKVFLPWLLAKLAETPAADPQRRYIGKEIKN